MSAKKYLEMYEAQRDVVNESLKDLSKRISAIEAAFKTSGNKKATKIDLTALETKISKVESDLAVAIAENKSLRKSLNDAYFAVYAVTKYMEIVTGKNPDEINRTVEKLKNDELVQQKQRQFDDKVSGATMSTVSGFMVYADHIKETAEKTKTRKRSAAQRIKTAAKETK